MKKKSVEMEEIRSEKMNNMKIAKFEILVEDINEAIKGKNLFCLSRMAACIRMENNREKEATPLYLVFEPENFNDFAKVICDKAKIYLQDVGSSGFTDPWKEKYRTESFVDSKIRIDAAKDFVKYCRESNNRSEAYKFIFWSLMILTVQKDDYDEKLSLICDFVRMLRISDDELMDISYTIKCIYNEVDTEYVFKSETVPAVLGNLLNLYGNSNTNIE